MRLLMAAETCRRSSSSSSSSSLLMIVFLVCQYFFQTSLANPNSCTPSSCGIIGNISYPFRLKDDPTNCGDRRAELTCENNVTFIYLSSHSKYTVKDINYGEITTVRVVDASINSNDTCSFPISSAYFYNFSRGRLYPYLSGHTSRPIYLMSCPTPLKNSSSSSSSSLVFTDITRECASNSSSLPRFTYIKVGNMMASEVPRNCGIDLTVMTSWKKFKDSNSNKNVSLSEIHHSILYGFELTLCLECIDSVWDNFIGFFRTYGLLLIPLTIVVLLTAGVSLPLMIIIGLTGVLVLSFIYLGWIPNCIISLFLKYLTLIYFVETFIIGQLFIDGMVFRPNYSFLGIILSIIIGAPKVLISPLVVLWLLIYKFRRRHLSIFDVIESFLQSDNNLTPIRYSYLDIKKITKCFKDKLGQGGYGSVYKGKLRSGHYVAVKLLEKIGANGGQDFINEIATIGRIHHINVIKLVGYCAQGCKRALVFDFMPNGSLEKYILNQEKMNSLNWDTKFDIAIGIARGIEYLHRGCDIQILHFDIKPHNILLDDKFIPKISDFGLAKFCSTDKNSVTMPNARGTIGYVAPELISRSIGAISYKADVYSFGMLLIDMVGLKRNLIEDNGDSDQYFPYWIYDCFNQGRDIEIGLVEENDNSDIMKKIARKMTIVALWCIQMSPDDRPSMNKVLEMLEGDVEHLQLPEYTSGSNQIVINVNQDEITYSTISASLLRQDSVLPSVL